MRPEKIWPTLITNEPTLFATTIMKNQMKLSFYLIRDAQQAIINNDQLI